MVVAMVMVVVLVVVSLSASGSDLCSRSSRIAGLGMSFGMFPTISELERTRGIRLLN